MKVTAMLLLCQVLHALCHCPQCSDDMGIPFFLHDTIHHYVEDSIYRFHIDSRNLAGALLLSNIFKIIFSILFTT
jgi:hypothetical protein